MPLYPEPHAEGNDEQDHKADGGERHFFAGCFFALGLRGFLGGGFASSAAFMASSKGSGIDSLPLRLAGWSAMK